MGNEWLLFPKTGMTPAGLCSKQRKGDARCEKKYLSSGRNLLLQDVADAKILVEFRRGSYNVFHFR